MMPKNFKISIKPSLLSQEEKRQILHQVFDILFSVKKKVNEKLNQKIKNEIDHKN